MIKKLFTKLAIFAFLFALLIPATTVQATDWENSFGFDDPTIQNIAGSNQDLELNETIANIINLVLGFLGLIAVVIILIGGFKWMTAGGNEEKVGEAKKLLIAGLIG